ncbi:MAG TPA: N-formylglutamate amidohydrolase [Anaerolineae bacterium]|nr:N-formylglutamate amidohydrolase [Anaerolineae bacterium]
MMSKREPAPVAIFIPHGGLAEPDELVGRHLLTAEQIFNEADVYAEQLFDFRGRVKRWHYFPYARALLDVNRPADKYAHHRSGDGVVKWQTSYGAPVYRVVERPDDDEEAALVRKYWGPWDGHLAAAAADGEIKLVVDCHSMAAVGPTQYDDPAAMRPEITVCNYGDERGEIYPPRGRITASGELTRLFAGLLAEAFEGVEPLVAAEGGVAINRPFWGNWDLIGHAHEGQVWLMIEVNRALYIGEQSGDSPIVAADEVLLADLRERIWRAIEGLVGVL